MMALSFEEAQAIRDRLKGKPHDDSDFAFLRGVAKLTRAVDGFAPVLLPERCADCDQSPCVCLAIDTWRGV